MIRMKKFLTALVLISCLVPATITLAAKCGDEFNGSNPDVSVNDALNNCTPDGAMTSKVKKDVKIGGDIGSALGGSIGVSTDSGNYDIRTGAKERIVSLVQNLMIAGGILAVAGIVFSAILMTTALGDDKKLGEAKNGIKYSAIGFLCIVIAFPLVNGVINLIYSIVGS